MKFITPTLLLLGLATALPTAPLPHDGTPFKFEDNTVGQKGVYDTGQLCILCTKLTDCGVGLARRQWQLCFLGGIFCRQTSDNDEKH